MHRPAFIATSLASLLSLNCLSAAEAASGENFSQIVARADRAYAAADFDQAQKIYEEALSRGKEEGVKKPDLAVILSDIAIIQKLHYQLEEAQGNLADALPLAGDDEALVATLQTRLSSVCRARGNMYGALDHAREALVLRRKLNPDSVLLAEALNNVAVVSLDLKHMDDAVNYCDQALETIARAGKSGAPEELVVLNTKASAMLESQKYGPAREMFSQTLSKQEALFGSKSPKLATTLSNLAMTFTKEKRYGDARPYLERALQICESANPPDTAGAADAAANLAGNYAHEGDKASAEVNYQKAIKYARVINYRHLKDIEQDYQLFVAASKGFIEAED